jgi:hypothetical protein
LGDQHNEPKHRKGVRCPRDYAFVLMAERFGKWPWEIEEAPIDRVLYYLGILGVEGEVGQSLSKLKPGAQVIWEE